MALFQIQCQRIRTRDLRLYDSEINVKLTVSSLWDSGFHVKLGDEMNGFAGVGG
jgi:hypothetical protein